ncbi:helix-turn-helix domain-containing protein [Caballeronia sp. KNU42]
MGRKSKLTEEQWAQVKVRLLEGESRRAIAKEFGVSESSIREKVSAQVAEIKIVANQIVATEQALKALPISAQVSAHNLAARLRAVSDHLIGAAEHSAASSHRLSILANQQLQRVDEVNPMASPMELQAVASLQKMANLSSEIGLNLLRANKEAVDDIGRRGAEEEGIGGAVGSPEEYKTALREVLKEI